MRKMGRFPGEMREKGCWMSGAAARTGSLRKKEEKEYINVGNVRVIQKSEARKLHDKRRN